MFGMLGIFSEFEREMIRARVNAGLDRRRREGKSLGRPKVGRERDPETRKARKDQRDDAIRMLREGESMNHVMRKTGLGSSAVQRMNRELKTAPTN
jgi:DNA invertase Pin-like site-specific DNA recombinase